nr:hypothetical protein HUO10_003037 [Paraburkholderia busanensis]
MQELKNPPPRQIPPGPLHGTVASLIAFLMQDGLKLALGAIVGGAIGLGSSYLMARQWQATVTAQIGQLYNGTSAVLLEQPANVVARFQLRAFRDEALKRLGYDTNPAEDARTRLFMKSLTLKVVSSDLVQIDINGNSPEEAKREVVGLLDTLRDAHQQIMDGSLQRLNSDLADTNQLLSVAQARAETLAHTADVQLQDKGNASTSSTNLMLTELIDGNNRELAAIRSRKNELMERLDPQRTFNTRPLVSATSSDQPVSPKRLVLLVAGMLLGIGVALGWTLCRPARRRL